jgi:hypothetical protein
MIQVLAHITQNELPGLWTTAIVGFAAGVSVGVAVAYGLLSRRFK